MVTKKDLEVTEKITVMNETRFRVRVKGTRIVFDVHALNEEEALEKAVELAKTISLEDRIINALRGASQ
jgi:uncharacterized OsmC-like protein